MLRYTTRSVRRASGLVLVGNPSLTRIMEGLPVRLGSNQEFEETITNTCAAASVQRFGMHNLHQAMIVSVVHRHSDQHGALHGKGFL